MPKGEGGALKELTVRCEPGAACKVEAVARQNQKGESEGWCITHLYSVTSIIVTSTI